MVVKIFSSAGISLLYTIVPITWGYFLPWPNFYLLIIVEMEELPRSVLPRVVKSFEASPGQVKPSYN